MRPRCWIRLFQKLQYCLFQMTKTEIFSRAQGRRKAASWAHQGFVISLIIGNVSAILKSFSSDCCDHWFKWIPVKFLLVLGVYSTIQICGRLVTAVSDNRLVIILILPLVSLRILNRTYLVTVLLTSTVLSHKHKETFVSFQKLTWALLQHNRWAVMISSQIP